MKEENKEVSRRDFLTKGAAVASIIVIPSAVASSVTAKEGEAQTALANEPVFTNDIQTLRNKTITNLDNDLSSDDVFVNDFFTLPTTPDSNGYIDITSELNAAINHLSGKGGRILIPQGKYKTSGGHEFGPSISIEGAGVRTQVGATITYGTDIKLTSGGTSVFRATANIDNCSLKNLTIDMNGVSGETTGLLLTGAAGSSMHLIDVENVSFYGGTYGIKVESTGSSTDFECISNRFVKLSFYACGTAFYCNSVNGGYLFDTCFFAIKYGGGVALDCESVGGLSLDNCLFVGNNQNGSGTPLPHVPPTNNTTILKTEFAYVSISFHNCQDENVQTYYTNVSPNHYSQVPLVFRNCLIQAPFRALANSSFVFDSCRINVTKETGQTKPIAYVEDKHTPSNPPDPTDASVEIHLKGKNDFFNNLPNLPKGKFDHFENPWSVLLYESNEIGLPNMNPTLVFTQTYSVNESRGIVFVQSGWDFVHVANLRVTVDSLVFAHFRKNPGKRTIKYIESFPGYFTIFLDDAATEQLEIGFKVESATF